MGKKVAGMGRDQASGLGHVKYEITITFPVGT